MTEKDAGPHGFDVSLGEVTVTHAHCMHCTQVVRVRVDLIFQLRLSYKGLMSIEVDCLNSRNSL